MAVMLTTRDNPFNPFTQFDEWQEFDESQGYYTCQYLARVTPTSSSLTKDEQEVALENGIDEIVKINVFGNYVKLSDTDPFPIGS